MAKRLLPILPIAIVAILWLMNRGGATTAEDTFEYQGHQIKLSKAYSSYEDYKSDPDNIAASDVSTVQELAKSAPVASHYATRALLTAAMFEIKFPGYSVGSYATTPQPDGSVLELWGVEVPHGDCTRFLLFRSKNGAYDLADDFVQKDGPMIAKVTAVGETIVYSTSQGAKVAERTPSIK